MAVGKAKILILEATFIGRRRGLFLAVSLRRQGNEVYYLTNALQMGKPHLKPRGTSEGVFIIEVPNLLRYLPQRGILMRGLIHVVNSLMFLWAILKNMRIFRNIDVIIIGDPTHLPPVTRIPALLLKKITGALLFVDVREPLGEDIVAFTSSRFWIIVFRILSTAFNKFSFMVSDGIITHAKTTAKLIARYTRMKPHCVYNAIDLHTFRPMTKTSSMRALAGILPIKDVQEKFVVLYAGSMYPPKNLDRVLDAAKLLEGEKDIVFIFIGQGEEREHLKKRAREENIRNVVFWPCVPWKIMPYILNIADVCLITLKNHPAYLMAFPKKFFEYAACGKAIICFCPRGELTSLVERWGAGVAVKADDAEELARVIKWLSENKELVVNMGRNARRMAEVLFSPERIGKQLDGLLKEALSSKPR